MSKAKQVIYNFNKGVRRGNFCTKTFRDKTSSTAKQIEVNGDDITYTFSDGSMARYRSIVKEFQLFKG